MASLLVTGGAGFIGSNFVRLLLANGGEILRATGCSRLVNLDALTYAGHRATVAEFEGRPDYRFVPGDIGGPEVSALLSEERVLRIVNFAAESHVDRSIDSCEPFLQTNVVGTGRLLDAARRHWKALGPVEAAQFRFLHVSTDEVFGSLAPDEEAFHEETAYHPNNPYAASKAASDHLVRAFAHTHKLPILITNCSNNYGPYQFPEKLIPLMILNALEGRSLPVYGDGQNIRDWLFVEDHARALVAVLAGGGIGETYCVGGCNEVRNLDLVRRLCDTLDQLAPPRSRGLGVASYADLITFVADRPGHDRRYAINASRIGRELGWTPRETFETGLRKTIEWYLANGNWCRSVTEARYARQRLGAG